MTKELQDHVWSILPKEFKEEVKKLYSRFLFTREGYYNELLGKHNLTSDAEGEDNEMLYVSRKRVQELYASHAREHRNDASAPKNNVSVNRISLASKNAMLAELFGSKCLPDETKDGTKDETKEPKPASKMEPIESRISVYLATAEEDEEFRLLLHENGFAWNGGDSLINSSEWKSDIESAKIHFIYPDKTVTYNGGKTSGTLTFSEFKKQYFEEKSRNLSQETANCDKHFNTILKDSFSKERRLNIATQILSGIVASSKPCKHPVKRALELADALLAECGKGGSDGN